MRWDWQTQMLAATSHPHFERADNEARSHSILEEYSCLEFGRLRYCCYTISTLRADGETWTRIGSLQDCCVAINTTSARKQATGVEPASGGYDAPMLAIAPRLHFGGGGESCTHWYPGYEPGKPLLLHPRVLTDAPDWSRTSNLFVLSEAPLPIGLQGHIGMAGFEPATFGSQNRCATKLRHIPLILLVRFELTHGLFLRQPPASNWATGA